MNYLSSSVISGAQAIIDGVHNTFGQTITAYKHAQEVVLATNPQYNAIYKANSSVQKTSVSLTFQARILAVDADEDLLLAEEIDSQIKIGLPKGIIRLKIDNTGYEFVKDAIRVNVNGNMYTIYNDELPEHHGAWVPRYNILYLTPIDE